MSLGSTSGRNTIGPLFDPVVDRPRTGFASCCCAVCAARSSGRGVFVPSGEFVLATAFGSAFGSTTVYAPVGRPGIAGAGNAFVVEGRIVYGRLIPAPFGVSAACGFCSAPCGRLMPAGAFCAPGVALGVPYAPYVPGTLPPGYAF